MLRIQCFYCRQRRLNVGILSTVLTCLYSATFYYGDAFITQPQAIILTILNMYVGDDKANIKLLNVFPLELETMVSEGS